MLAIVRASVLLDALQYMPHDPTSPLSWYTPLRQNPPYLSHKLGVGELIHLYNYLNMF